MTLPQYDRERLERLLGGVSLTDFRARLRARFERGSSASMLTLTRLAVHERETLTGPLLGTQRDAETDARLTETEVRANHAAAHHQRDQSRSTHS